MNMAEPIDVILPILQRIQSDLTETKRDLSLKIDHLSEQTSSNSETLEAIQRYFLYQLGMTTKNEADIEHIQDQIKTIEARLAALEAHS
jgi:hypothetical protein